MEVDVRGPHPPQRDPVAAFAQTDAAIESAFPGLDEATAAVFTELGEGGPLIDPLNGSLVDDLVSATSSKPGKGRK